MKRYGCSNVRDRKAFTLLELFILVAGVAILSAIFLPALQRPHATCQRINCTNNLKQIGLASKTWALDNSDRFPMSVPVNEGGTMELVAGSSTFAAFAVMSNELSTPKILICPEDRKRHWATNFESDLNNSKLSYFVGLDAGPTNLTMLLSGDRNLTNNFGPLRGHPVIRPGDSVGWTHEVHHSAGNLLMVDGSVQQLTTSTLRTTLRSLGATNRLAMP